MGPKKSLILGVVAGLVLTAACGCSGDKPAPASQPSNDALKKEAAEQKKMHEREMYNR